MCGTEYAYTTKVNEKSDVYSFGVVLLELATGREAHNGDRQTSLVEWAWRHFQEDKPMEDALDIEIVEAAYSSSMATAFKLGLMCTSTLPSSRPSMKEVLQILQQYSPDPLTKGGKKAYHDFDVAPLLYSPKSGTISSKDLSSSDEEDNRISYKV